MRAWDQTRVTCAIISFLGYRTIWGSFNVEIRSQQETLNHNQPHWLCFSSQPFDQVTTGIIPPWTKTATMKGRGKKNHAINTLQANKYNSTNYVTKLWHSLLNIMIKPWQNKLSSFSSQPQLHLCYFVKSANLIHIKGKVIHGGKVLWPAGTKYCRDPRHGTAQHSTAQYAKDHS